MKKIAIWLIMSLMLLMMACNGDVGASHRPTSTPDEKIIFIGATATPTTRPTTEPTAAMTNEPTPDVEEPETTESANPTDSPTSTPKATKKPTTTATPKPTKKPTPAPTATPSPTSKPTPVPTVTPNPTSEPTLEPTNEPTPDPNDLEDDGPQLPIVPLSDLVVSEEFAKTYGGLYIYRNNKLYTTSPIPIELAMKYNVGRVNAKFKKIANLAGFCKTEGSQHFYLSIGEKAPMIYVMEGDEFRVYGGSTAEFREIDYYGFTFNSYYSDDKMVVYENPQESYELVLSDVTHIELRDTENLFVDDYLWLDFGADYKMLWKDSSGSHELKLKGDCECYNYDEHSGDIIIVPGMLSENGEFYTVDLPELLSGTLYVYAGGQMSIIAFDEE